MPYEEYDRLKGSMNGYATPVSDIGMIFLNDIEVMTDPNVRKAAVASIDKQAIIDRLLSGYGVKIDTLETPQYDAFDASITVAYDPDAAVAALAASGYSVDNPVKFKIQTTKGFKPKDYEMIQAIVGLWRKVGIEAEIEVYDIAKHYELRAADQLAPAAFYNWGNSVGDPTTSTGFAMFGPSPHSVWDGAGSDRHDRPVVGRGGRGQADCGVEGSGQVCRRQQPGDPAAAIRPAGAGGQGGGGDAPRIRGLAAASDEARLRHGRGDFTSPQLCPRASCCPSGIFVNR